MKLFDYYIVILLYLNGKSVGMTIFLLMQNLILSLLRRDQRSMSLGTIRRKRNTAQEEWGIWRTVLKKLRKKNPTTKELKESFNPICFEDLIHAVETFNGYNPKIGSVEVGGMAYRFLQALQHCMVHRANRTEEIYSLKIKRSFRDRYSEWYYSNCDEKVRQSVGSTFYNIF